MLIDEKQFFIDIYRRCGRRPFSLENPKSYVTPRDLIQKEDFPLHPARAHYLMHQWYEKGWYVYGLFMDKGSLTALGRKKAEQLLGYPKGEVIEFPNQQVM